MIVSQLEVVCLAEEALKSIMAIFAGSCKFIISVKALPCSYYTRNVVLEGVISR